MRSVLGTAFFFLFSDRGTSAPEHLRSPPLSSRARVTTPATSIATIAAYCQHVDRYVRQHSKARRLFTQYAGASHWIECPSAKARDEGRGYPDDADADVWMSHGKVVYVTLHVYGGSGTSYSSYAQYYFRPDGTLAKLDFTHEALGTERVSEIRFYNARGAVLRSTLGSKRQSANTSQIPDWYLRRHTRDLPFYRLLHKRVHRRRG